MALALPHRPRGAQGCMITFKGRAAHKTGWLTAVRSQMDPGSRAREVVVSCPYWIVNKTNLILRVKDTTLNATQPLTAPPGLGGQADPVLFR